MLLVSFLTNLLCAIASCPPNFGEPGEKQPMTLRGLSLRRSIGLSSDFDLNVDREPPFVETENGFLEGYFMRAMTREIYAFEGIPYAEWDKSGKHRFRPPVAKRPWKGIRQAKVSAPYCLQMHAFFLNRILGVEDCLQLNLYTPRLPMTNSKKKKRRTEDTKENSGEKLLPVLVFLHGGSWQFSSAKEYGPAYLLERDVVVVTVNYRLGILGFLSTNDSSSPGNNGLRDQALAIKWVHANIHKFSGDPQKITLIGESAGAVSVNLHMVSPLPTKNYFHQAISMSSTALNFWAVQSANLAKKWTHMAAKLARCPVEDGSQALMDCMRSRNPVSLVSNQFRMQDYYPSYPSIMFGPVLESPDDPDSVLIEMPEETYRRNATAAIPFIISNTDAEGEVAIIALPTIFRFTPFRTQWRKMAPIFLDYKNIEGLNQDYVTNAVEEHYFKNGESPLTMPMSGFSNMTTDRYFSPGVYRSIQAHSKIAPTFSSVFSYRGRFGLPAAFGHDHAEYRVGHTEDLFYIFNMSSFSQGLKTTDPEYKISEKFIDLIVNFANTGSPLATMADGNLTEIWPAVTDPENVIQLSIGDEIKMVPYPPTAMEGIRFWESLNLTEKPMK